MGLLLSIDQPNRSVKNCLVFSPSLPMISKCAIGLGMACSWRWWREIDPLRRRPSHANSAVRRHDRPPRRRVARRVEHRQDTGGLEAADRWRALGADRLDDPGI